MHATSILQDGVVRHLGKMLMPLCSGTHLSLAESLITKAALRFVVSTYFDINQENK